MVKDIKKLLEKYETEEEEEGTSPEIEPKKKREIITKETKPSKKIKLDAYDEKILEALLNNSREQVSTIGKKIRLRRENVNYRLNRLIKEGLIKEFNTIFNEKKLGLSRYVMFLELINLQENTEGEILDYLKNSKYMSWIGTSAGKWSLIFDVIIPEQVELNKIINGLLNRFNKFIDDYVILKLQDSDYFGFKFSGLIEKRNVVHSFSKKVKLDDKDKEILSLLNKNSRTSLVEISGKVDLTPNGVGNRIKNLEKEGLITGYTISLDWKKLGYEWYGLQLKLIRFGEDIEKKLAEFFKAHKRIVFYNKYLGGTWDYDVGLIVRNSIELRDFINEFRTNFSDAAKISDVFITLEETSGYKMPRGVFEVN